MGRKISEPHPSASASRDSDPGRQRRGSRRLDLTAEVHILEPLGGEGVTINVSEGGYRVAVDCPLARGDACLLRITEPAAPTRIERAVVVWSRQLPDGWIVGLQRVAVH